MQDLDQIWAVARLVCLLDCVVPPSVQHGGNTYDYSAYAADCYLR